MKHASGADRQFSLYGGTKTGERIYPNPHKIQEVKGPSSGASTQEEQGAWYTCCTNHFQGTHEWERPTATHMPRRVSTASIDDIVDEKIVEFIIQRGQKTRTVSIYMSWAKLITRVGMRMHILETRGRHGHYIGTFCCIEKCEIRSSATKILSIVMEHIIQKPNLRTITLGWNI